jgi:hypothetical protein
MPAYRCGPFVSPSGQKVSRTKKIDAARTLSGLSGNRKAVELATVGRPDSAHMCPASEGRDAQRQPLQELQIVGPRLVREYNT